MSTKQEILNLFEDDVEERKKKVGDYLKDHTNSYEDRKEVFLSTPKHLFTIDQWVLHLPSFEKEHGEISWYDDFNAERYTKVDLVEVCNDMEDFFLEDWSDEKKEAFIRAVVDKGFHSFNYDW